MSSEKISSIEQKIQQLKNQKQALENRESTSERKARTRKLIQCGALAQKYLQLEGCEVDEFQIALDYLLANDEVQKIIRDDISLDKIRKFKNTSSGRL